MSKGAPAFTPGLEARSKIEGNYVTLAPETRVVFCIPCKEGESRVIQALKTYLQLDATQRAQCEVCILVNSEKGNQSPLAATIKNFATAQTGLKISVYTAESHEGSDLATIQNELFNVVKERSASGAAPLIVSHHADLLNASGEYINNILAKFDADPDLDLLAGLVDYPREDFHQDHLFFAVQLFEDLLEEKLREETGKVLAHGGNAAFRLSAMDKSGFKAAFEADNAPIYLKPRQAPEGINVLADDELMWVTTAARRQMSALDNTPPILLANRYKSSIVNTLSESAHKVTSANFAVLLEQELSAICAELMKNRPYSLSQERLATLFAETGLGMGITLEANHSTVHVKDLAEFKGRALKDFSTF